MCGTFVNEEEIDLKAINSLPQYLSEISRSDQYVDLDISFRHPIYESAWTCPLVYVTGASSPEREWAGFDVTVDDDDLRKSYDEGLEDAAAWLPTGSCAWISPSAVTNDSYRFIQSLDFFTTVAGVFEGPDEPRFDYVSWDAITCFDPSANLCCVPYDRSAIYHRSLRGLAADYARMYLCGVRKIPLTRLMPRYGMDNPAEELRKLEIQQQGKAEQTGGTISVSGSLEDPTIAGHLTLAKVKELLELSEDEMRRRLHALPKLAPECSWIDAGERGVILAVPPDQMLANDYRALAQ